MSVVNVVAFLAGIAAGVCATTIPAVAKFTNSRRTTMIEESVEKIMKLLDKEAAPMSQVQYLDFLHELQSNLKIRIEGLEEEMEDAG